MKRKICNEKGIVLITTLMLVVLGLAVVATLLQLVTSSSKLSGIESRYAAALDASKGGSDFIISMLLNDLSSPTGTSVAGESSPTPACLQEKMTKPKASWSASCTASAKNLNVLQSPDLTMTLSGYGVSVKIVDTFETSPNPLASPPDDGFFFYTILARATNPTTNEYAEISFLYRVSK